MGGEFDNLFFENNPGGIPLIFQIVFENNIQIEVALLKKVDGYGLDLFQWKYKDDTHEYALELQDDNLYVDNISHKNYECCFKGFIPTKFIEKNTIENLSERFKINKIDVDYIGPFRILPELNNIFNMGYGAVRSLCS